MIHVIAEIEVHSGQRDAFLTEFHRIVPIVRDEDGCLEYGPAIDMPGEIDFQPPLRENVVTVIEKWSSVATLREHLSAAHMVEYRKRAGNLIASVRISVLKPV